MKNFCRKKSQVPSAFYFHTLLVWAWSRLHSRERCALLQGVTVLGVLLNTTANHWEFSDQSGHSWNVFLPCASSDKCSAYPLVIFYLGFFKVPPLYTWPSTQQCLHNVPVLISNALSPRGSFLCSSVPQLPAPSASLTSHLPASPRRMLASTSLPLLHAPGPKTASRQKAG